MDESRGLVKKTFELKAPASKDANSQVISPLTDLVVKHMDANQGVSKQMPKKLCRLNLQNLKPNQSCCLVTIWPRVVPTRSLKR